MCFSLLALTDLFAGFEWCEPLKPWMILYTNCWAFNLKFDACQGQFYIFTVCLHLKQDTTPNKTNIYNNKAEDETVVIMWMQRGGTFVSVLVVLVGKRHREHRLPQRLWGVKQSTSFYLMCTGDVCYLVSIPGMCNIMKCINDVKKKKEWTEVQNWFENPCWARAPHLQTRYVLTLLASKLQWRCE